MAAAFQRLQILGFACLISQPFTLVADLTKETCKEFILSFDDRYNKASPAHKGDLKVELAIAFFLTKKKKNLLKLMLKHWNL